MKVRIGGHPPAEELPLLQRLREQLPGHITLMADAWGSYAPTVAENVGRRLGELGFAWFEEPTKLTHHRLASRLAVPIAGGELGRTRMDFVRWLDENAFDVVQPDAAICGGLGNARFVGELAALREVACVPHTWNGAIMAAATLHLAAVLPPVARLGDGGTGPMLEYDTTENPFIREVVRNPPQLVQGCFTVPDCPGLGVDIDEDRLDKYRWR
jgi:D-galactarolactone cycloisomerase